MANEIAIAGSTMSNAELVVNILSGLGSEYHPIAVVIRTRDTPISYEDLFDKLIDQESFFKHEDLRKPSLPITSAIAQRNGGGNNSRPQRRPSAPNQWRPQNQFSRTTPWRPNHYTNFRTSQPRSRDMPRCQLCD